MPPSQVKHIVRKSQEKHARDGQQGGQQLRELLVGELHHRLLPGEVRAIGSGDHHDGDDQEHTTGDHATSLGNFLAAAFVQVNPK